MEFFSSRIFLVDILLVIAILGAVAYGFVRLVKYAKK